MTEKGFTDEISEQTGIEDFSSIAAAIEGYLEDKAKEGASGNYRSNAESFLNHRWKPWLIEHSITSIHQLDRKVLKQYATHLSQLTEDDEIVPSTAQSYFHIVSAVLTWCRNKDLITTNPATYPEVQDCLPDEIKEEERQFWSEEKRMRLLEAVDKRAIIANPDKKLSANRDRALVYLIAFSGARSAEILRDPSDDRRTGITWNDIDFDRNTIQVLGQSQNYEGIPLPRQAKEPIETLKEIQSPESGKWPVFTSHHAPSMVKRVVEGLQERSYDEDEISNLRSEHPTMSLFHKYDIIPPALSKKGGRIRFKKVCKDFNIEIEGDYLQPFGARRQLGRELFTESIEIAQKGLRSYTIESIHDRYSKGEH
ncbi:tyrosine-type recombinase/integrase [Haladaptatus halobius]|uniref:tyrosine-type recombinase/integrase n=1 Tax=Haladaptatus halobius TaxID=2884875 RepID=UPI001D0B6DA8|nr:phage integrase SAM-like domain-containing protein [Haladaptatus halobius]